MRALLMACGPWTYSCQHASTTTKTLQSEHSRIFAYSNSPVSSASFLFKQLHWLYRLLLAENVGSYIMSHPYTLDIKSTNTVNSSERLKTSRSQSTTAQFYFLLSYLLTLEALQSTLQTYIFKTRLDKFWTDQDCKYLWKAKLSGTGSRSEVLCNYDDP